MQDGYLLNGTKNWITNGPNAQAAVIFATSDKVKFDSIQNNEITTRIL